MRGRRVALGSDHGGFPLKGVVAAFLSQSGCQVLDVGTWSEDAVDYPDIARAVGEAILDGRAERGIILCGSGIGACVAANKLPGIRAGVAQDSYSARQGVEHDDVNVLCLGARVMGPQLAQELVRSFMEAEFSGEERHRRRLAKVEAMEERERGRRS
ncbi:MAG: ribose 5-phosphate isomerase B [Syntrophomonadaceae bacterium]|nr:ribose 5-phosphate isomerase B [Syntrophomonadaceae bacterium]